MLGEAVSVCLCLSVSLTSELMGPGVNNFMDNVLHYIMK